MHAFLTHMRAKPGQRDEVIRLTTIMLEKTQSEDGTTLSGRRGASGEPGRISQRQGGRLRRREGL